MVMALVPVAALLLAAVLSSDVDRLFGFDPLDDSITWWPRPAPTVPGRLALASPASGDAADSQWTGQRSWPGH
jgi:hypothetical protein